MYMGIRKGGIFLAFLLSGISLWGQSMSKGDSLMRECRFEQAIMAYIADSDDRGADRAQLALSMADFCTQPNVVARKCFSRNDFYLYYPLAKRAWREGPGGIIYLPKGARELYFSAPDKAGTESLFFTRDLDSLWQAPVHLGEAFLSTGHESFPMLSKDGKTLFFASDGLMGMGGYDIFYSTWNEEQGLWNNPVNMGFPFNSPADDFLMADSDDGKYTLFASNRSCTPDSVYVYVTDFEKNPARKAVREPSALKKLLELMPVEDPSRIDNAAAVEGFSSGNAVTQKYMLKMEESRALMDSISRHMSPGDSLLPVFRAHLALVSAELREVEMSFLMSGAVTLEEDREVVGAELSYTFARSAMGQAVKLPLAEVPQATSYRIAPIGRFAPDNTLPPGLVYQILLFDSPTHATLDDICGLSPVYERMGSNFRYCYYVGLFPTYEEALAELNVIRLLGFPAARIIAWQDGTALQHPTQAGTAQQRK